jgi:hypothetical protein
MAIFATFFISKIYKWNKLIGIVCLTVIIIIQSVETFSWLQIKWQPDPRQVSSQWLENNMHPNSLIGIENVPIYQYLPDKVVKDFYEQQSRIFTPIQFQYNVIDANTKKFPQYLIVSNAAEEKSIFPNSPKIDVLNQLQKKKYKQIAFFPIPRGINRYFVDDRVFYWTYIDPVQEISIFSQ